MKITTPFLVSYTNFQYFPFNLILVDVYIDFPVNYILKFYRKLKRGFKGNSKSKVDRNLDAVWYMESYLSSRQMSCNLYTTSVYQNLESLVFIKLCLILPNFVSFHHIPIAHLCISLFLWCIYMYIWPPYIKYTVVLFPTLYQTLYKGIMMTYYIFSSCIFTSLFFFCNKLTVSETSFGCFFL